MQPVSKTLAADMLLLLSLATRALCHPGQHRYVQQAAPASSYSYFSMSVPSHHYHHGAHGLLEAADGAAEDNYHHAPAVSAYPKYAFKYGVEDAHTGDYKDASEHRDGDVVRGEYSLLQPDGRKRTVHYTASKHGGFNAVVSYSGHAVHPEQLQHDDDDGENY